MVEGALALLAGLALQTIVDGDCDGDHAALLELFKTLGALVVPAPGTASQEDKA